MFNKQMLIGLSLALFAFKGLAEEQIKTDMYTNSLGCMSCHQGESVQEEELYQQEEASSAD